MPRLEVNWKGKRLFAVGKQTPIVLRSAFKGAESSRLTDDWITGDMPADKYIAQDLTKLRQRAADLERNNDYIRRFLREVEINVIGDRGIRYEPRIPKRDARNANGFSSELDTQACKTVAAAWAEFSKKENFTVSRRFSRRRFEQLMVRAVARDGGSIIRSVRGFDKNPFRFALQSFRVNHLDHRLTDPAKRIHMGVESDEWDHPTAYHLKKRQGSRMTGDVEHFRLETTEARHIFLADDLEQTVGVPWYASAMFRLRQLEAYEEAEVIAARLQAQKIGFFELAEGAQYTGATDGTPHAPSGPGEWEELPHGVSAKLIDPSHPNGNYPDFRKAMLRGITAGLICNYNTLANDLEGVNFSSIRAATLSERESWTNLQSWIIDDFEAPIFQDWLRMAILSDQIPYKMVDFDRLSQATFAGRRWAWVDPMKDIKAAAEEIELGINSRRRVAGDRGRDFAEVVAENAEDQKAMVADAPDGGDKSGGQSPAEAIQKVYLGVGKVVTSDEARQIVNDATGTNLALPGPDFEPAPQPPAPDPGGDDG